MKTSDYLRAYQRINTAKEELFKAAAFVTESESDKKTCIEIMTDIDRYTDRLEKFILNKITDSTTHKGEGY